VVAALVEDEATARASARATLVDVIDALAPFDSGPGVSRLEPRKLLS
jgi:hypothetical protein